MWTWPPWHLCRSEGILICFPLCHFEIIPQLYKFLKTSNFQGAGLVHFQDFNAEVLRCLTIPNVKANLLKKSSQGTSTSRSIGFYAGDWSEIDKLLLCGDAVQDKITNLRTENEGYRGYDIILMAETVYALDSLPSLYRLVKKVNIRDLPLLFFLPLL